MSQQRFIGYGRQLIDDDDVAAVMDVLRSDYLTQGPTVERFEQALAERVNVKHAIAVSSGTAALHVACLAAGMRPGSLGMTSALTFVASANAMIYCGAKVCLADIDSDSLGISSQTLAKALGTQPDTTTVIPVHFAGLAHDSAAVRDVAGKRTIIEDACHALGGQYEDGNSVGSCAHADMTVFSFHPIKSITTAEGGAVMTNDDDLAHKLRMFRNHGIERQAENLQCADQAYEEDNLAPWYYEQQVLGFNYRMSDLQAALGWSQLKKLDQFIARRREIVARYDEEFSQVSNISPTQSDKAQRARSAHHLYAVRIDFPALNKTRTEVSQQLHAQGIGTQVHYLPVYKQPYHQTGLLDNRPEAFAQTETFYQECLSLPLHAGLTDDEVERVIRAVEGVVGG